MDFLDMSCLKTPCFSIIVNGKPQGRIFASRGIRQGDPLSPFLNLLVSEVLGALLNKLVVNGRYEGFVVGKEKFQIPIDQFAEDTLLFCMYDESMLMKWKATITLFEWCSRQKVNWEKSALYEVNVEEDELKYMAGKMGCSSEKMPFLYLGLLLGGF